MYTANEKLSAVHAMQLVSFLANTVTDLVAINNETLADERDGDFVRLCDVQCVTEHLLALHSNANTAEYDYDYSDKSNIKVTTSKQASYNITAKQAQDALYGYDTEYRDCIMEQFADEHEQLFNMLFDF